MPIWPYKDFDACVIAQKNKWHDDESAKKICWAIKERVEWWEEENIDECFSEIILAEWEDVLKKQFELLTTAKQTDSRYWNFEFSKKDLQEMATNFNSNVVGTEIPVDLNHDPEHIAYAWITPWSMEVKESTQIKGQFSLFANLYKFTPEWKDMVQTGKIRYFSLQIQHKFEKFVDKTKKVFNNVIRALALTNMPVIKDMSPTFNEDVNKSGKNNLSDNPNGIMEKEMKEMQDNHAKELADAKLANDTALSEKEAENKKLSEQLETIEAEKHEAFLSENLEKLSLSDDNKIGFKGGEKEKIAEFVKTLSVEQSKAYFALHQDIMTTANFNEEGSANDGEEKTNVDEEKDGELAAEEANELATKMAKEESISFSDAMDKVLDQNKELSKKLY